MNSFDVLVHALFISVLMQVSLASLTSSVGNPSTSTATQQGPNTTGDQFIGSNSTVIFTFPYTSSSVATTSVGSNEPASVVVTQNPSITGSVPATRVASDGSTSVVPTQTGNITTSVAATSVGSKKSASVVATLTGNITTSVATTSVGSNGALSISTTTVVMPALNNSSSISATRDNTSASQVALTTEVAQSAAVTLTTVNSTVSKVGNSTQIAGTASISMGPNSPLSPSPKSTVPSSSTLGLKPSLNSSTSSLYPSANSTVSVNGSNSLQPTPSIGSSVYSNETSQSSQQVSQIPSSSGTPSNSTVSASGQTSNTSKIPSSDVITHSPSVSQSTQPDTSIPAQSSSMEISVMTQHLVGSMTISVSNSSSTPSPSVNATSTSSKTTPSTSTAAPPTLPPEGTKFVSMEVSFDIEFKNEYSDPNSPEYVELKNNLTTTLEEVYKNVDGFVAIRILFITKGSVVCNYIVILAKDSKVKESELKDKLEQASKDKKLGFTVKSVKVAEEDAEKPDEKLPKWALAVMIVLGCLSAVFLITVIYVCVKYRRSLYGSSDAYLVSTGEIGLVHTYETVSMGDNKMRANQGHGQKSTPVRRVIGSHTNPTYGSNGALAD